MESGKMQAYEVNAADIDQFQTDGAVALRGVLDAQWLNKIATAIEDDIKNPGPFYHGYDSDEGLFHGNLRLWESHPAFHDICLNSHLPAIAKEFLRSKKINLLYDQLFVKESRMSQRTRWHNDQPYWPISGEQVVSIWIALDLTTNENGRVEFIRGSHQWQRWFQPEPFGKTETITEYEKNPAYENIPDIEADRDSYEIVSWDLNPGDVYVFHAMTVHGSGGNLLHDRRRRGYTVRYTGDDVVYDQRIGTSPPLHCDSLSDGDPLDCDRYPLIIAA
jgi:ectoine hydroxylase-related dioxygenase (phytanoyl-CoA dioxygenase family)